MAVDKQKLEKMVEKTSQQIYDIYCFDHVTVETIDQIDAALEKLHLQITSFRTRLSGIKHRLPPV